MLTSNAAAAERGKAKELRGVAVYKLRSMVHHAGATATFHHSEWTIFD